MRDCTFNWPHGDEIALRVLRVDTWTPDENMGTRDYPSCEGTQRRYWGDLGRDDYYFKLAEIDDAGGWGWARASVSDVDVWY